MLNKEDFIKFICGGPGNRSTASTGTKGPKKESAMPEGLEGFGFDDDTPEEKPDTTKVVEATFARQLLEASGFGAAQYLATGEVILGGDPASQHLPDRVYYWPKTVARPYQTILFELAQPSDRLLKSTLFLPVKGVLEDALTSLVQRTLKGFEIGGEGRRADVKQGKQDETLCVVSIRDERSKDYDSAQLICFGTVARGEGSLETFHIREEARFWEPQLAQDHLERLYDRHFKKLASEKWQDAFISGDERKFARRLMEVCQGAKATESTIQEAVIDLLEQIALSYGLKKKPKAERRLEATDLPVDHDIGIGEGSGSNRRKNPFRGMTLRDEKNRLLGYIIYCLDSKKDADTLRSHLSANNRFHNVLVVYPNGESTGLELWQGKKPLEGKLTKRGAKFEGEGQVVNLLSRFFVVSKALVANPVQLAEELAYRARYLRAFALRELEKPKAERDKDLVALYQSFHDVFLKNEDADEAKQHDEFADSYAQTLTYGLLSARWISKDVIAARGERFTLDSATGLLERTSPFFKELFTQVISRSHDASRDWLLQDITDLLDRIDIDAIFSGVKDDGLLGHDPVMHFYEPFLAAYDAAIKRQRGVFYTPHPVVSYIVRSVHELLQTEFGLADGLADTTTWGEMLKKHPGLKLPPLTDEPGEKRTIDPDEPFVQILDPATGTATFPVEVIEVVFQHLKAKWAKDGLAAMPTITKAKNTIVTFADYWNGYVPEHLLPRLHGYELMMAAYAIAHLKIGLKLAETGYRFASTERARIYLTNALEPAAEKQMKLIGFDALAHEADAVNEIKRYKRFTVILGNPPYSAESQNPSVDTEGRLTHIGRLMRKYFQVDGQPLNERNPRWLQDDYVKFIRLGESAIDCSQIGVLGFITNHGYLVNPTFRGLRHSLLQTFSNLQMVDLHGNSKRGERCPDGSPDENVFDIQQGVAVMLATQPFGKNLQRDVAHSDLYGLRVEKYERIRSGGTLHFQSVTPAAPFFLFTPQDESLRVEFEGAYGLPSVFSSTSVGIVTGRDALTLHFTREDAAEVAKNFVAMTPEKARHQFDLGDDSRDWKVSLAQADLKTQLIRPQDCIQVAYRPFDVRFTFYSGKSRGFLCMPRGENMGHMLATRNLGLITARSNKSQEADHFFCTRFVSEAKCGESTTQSCLFPLYLGPQDGGLSFSGGCTHGLRLDFLRFFAQSLGLKQAKEGGLPVGLTPEDIFHYAYAVFHSPGYRSRYAEFLKIDFPRLPLTGNLELFRALARLGGELTALHLLESPKVKKPLTDFTGPSREVSKPGWTADNSGTVWIDAKGSGDATKAGASGFQGVPEAVWNFHIGGYQVCHKWLKDRKNRTLTDEDISHYHKIVIALSETIRLMKEIDEVIEKHGGWPLK
ncbi:MAG: type ISP restriction/modification enzyme [Verrucomicrobiota bacterium]